MNKIAFQYAVVVAVPALVAFAQVPASLPDQKVEESSANVRVTLKSCKPLRLSGTLGLLLTLHSSPNVELDRKGLFKAEGREFPIYLPDEPYNLKNAGDSDQVSENDATLIGVDADADGTIGEGEGWFANLPVRIGDKMYEVVAIDKKGKWIDLARSPKPLSGAVVGSALPDFSYKTPDGKIVSNADFRGKSFLIDIWSVT